MNKRVPRARLETGKDTSRFLINFAPFNFSIIVKSMISFSYRDTYTNSRREKPILIGTWSRTWRSYIRYAYFYFYFFFLLISVFFCFTRIARAPGARRADGPRLCSFGGEASYFRGELSRSAWTARLIAHRQLKYYVRATSLKRSRTAVIYKTFDAALGPVCPRIHIFVATLRTAVRE